MNNGWVIGIASGLIVLAILPVIGFFVEVKIWAIVANAIWKAITWFFTTNLTIWLAIGILYLFVFFKLRKRSS